MYCSIANKCNNYLYNIEEGYCKRLYEINYNSLHVISLIYSELLKKYLCKILNCDQFRFVCYLGNKKKKVISVIILVSSVVIDVIFQNIINIINIHRIDKQTTLLKRKDMK